MTTQEKQQITPCMTIGDILSKFPQKSPRLAQAMTLAGLHCSSCSAATWETLEEGMKGHGMNQTAIDKLVAQLNEILGEEVALDTISLTARAAKKFKEFAKEEGEENLALRFGLTDGGCRGFSYILEFSEGASESDATFISEGIEIHIAQEDLPRLIGSTIDYADGLQGAGFRVSNPNAKSSCGCGNSQSY